MQPEINPLINQTLPPPPAPVMQVYHYIYIYIGTPLNRKKSALAMPKLIFFLAEKVSVFGGAGSKVCLFVWRANHQMIFCRG